MSFLATLFAKAWAGITQRAKEVQITELRYDCKICGASMGKEYRLQHAKMHNPYIKKNFWKYYDKRRSS